MGVFGGLLAELAGLYKIRENDPNNLPDYLTSPFYWGVTILMILAGAGLAYAYTLTGQELGAILSINIGASAPLIIGKFTSSTPFPDAE